MDGLHTWDYCVMEGCLYPDDLKATVSGPRSVCTRCGEINHSLKGWYASETRKRRLLEKREADYQNEEYRKDPRKF